MSPLEQEPGARPVSLIDLADQYSRKRALLAAIVALVFLAVQLVGRPVFTGQRAASPGVSLQYWAINVVALLLVLATGGGLFNGARVRALVNDDVALQHRRSALGAGFWLAMSVAMALYILPLGRTFTAREAVYLIVTPSVFFALLTFSFLELRAHGV